MTTACPQCSMTLSLDDTRLPSEPFTVVCPRCRQSVTITPPPRQDAVLADVGAGGPAGDSDLLRGLSALLAGALKQSQPQKLDIDKWERRRVVLCVEDAQHRDRIRTQLDPARYELLHPNLAAEAVEILHESRAEAIVLSPNFDPDHQGGATMMQCVSRLTPQARRRMYVVLLSSQLRTLDTYLAFANGVNLTVHPEDIDSFQSIFERSVRDFNELYRPFNKASGIDPF